MSKKKGNRPGVRRMGRILAFQVLYGFSMNPVEGREQLEAQFERNPQVEAEENELVRDFARTLFLGVTERLGEVDELVEKFSQHWKIARIARVELAILRLSLYEMVHTDMPVKAAINEGVELAKKFGDGNSKNFINGILDARPRE
ncbi:transcription antitermination factor NusB [Salidesulfovibrio brasiliensis]|uniref:transcription antitermination factor NusB n=1 Tax=Salidesulfovibrio brasiliensis TaxID=221711 RepID=UPI0006D1A42E|nr:transcription antitermination factor NusB [Salidesulfovibrio brasiliensis]